MPDTFTLPVPPADTAELWATCTRLGERIHEETIARDRADHFGHVASAAQHNTTLSTLRMSHDIMVREYNRRTV